MKVFVYADLHVTEGPERCHNDPSRSLQHYRVTCFFEQAKAIIKAYGCDSVWDLGDTTDDRTAIPIPAIDALVQGMAGFPTGALNIKLVGNHEQYHRNTKVHMGRLYAPKFEIVDGIEVYALDSTAVVALAYPSDLTLATKTYREYIQALKSDYAKIVVLGHFDVVGARYRNGPVLAGIPADTFDLADIVLLGHVHKPQKLGHIHYVGSPFQQDYGEAGEQKRVLIFDTDTLDCTWVPLTDFPTYNIVDYTTFAASVRENSEDRYQVTLHTPSESATYYAHPLASHGIPVYAYTADAATKADAATPTNLSRWDLQAALTTWIHDHPITEHGLAAGTEAAVLATGLDLAK